MKSFAQMKSKNAFALPIVMDSSLDIETVRENHLMRVN